MLTSTRSVSFARALLLPAALLGLAMLSPGCSNRNISAPPSPVQEPEVASRETIQQTDTSSIEPTLGEQLGRLDALMRTATGDSLAKLQAEYDRLLNRAHGGEIQTGGNDAQQAGGSDILDAPPQVTNLDTTAMGPTPQLKGLRPSEIRFANGQSTPATPRRSAASATGNGGKPSAPAARAARSAAQSVPPSRPASTSGATSMERQKKLVDGLAAVRAGNYAKAVQDLPSALDGALDGAKRTEAQYSYALSLEKTGNLSKAAEHYLKASRADEGLGHKSYLSYCRVLAQSGQRDRARKLLAEFIQKHPKSAQVVGARQLLQTI